MTVKKFRSIEDMNQATPPVRDESAQDSFNRFTRHCARSWRLGARIFPRGVFKFRSMEEAQASTSAPGPRTPDPGF